MTDTATLTEIHDEVTTGNGLDDMLYLFHSPTAANMSRAHYTLTFGKTTIIPYTTIATNDPSGATLQREDKTMVWSGTRAEFQEGVVGYKNLKKGEPVPVIGG